MPCSCPVGARLNDEAIVALGTALLAAREAKPGAESLNAISRRTGLRKETLIRHRDECLRENGSPVRPGPNRPGPAKERREIIRESRSGPRGKLFEVKNPGDDPKTAPRKVIQLALEQECVALRVKGKSYAAIGAELDIDEDTARDAVERVLVRTRGKTDEKANVARAIEVQRCDELIAAHWQRATDPACAEVMVPADNEEGCRPYDGQDKATDRVVKIMERRAKLLGLDAPTSPSAQINIIQSPVFVEYTSLILGALAEHPDALEKVKATIRGALDARRAARLPSRTG